MSQFRLTPRIHLASGERGGDSLTPQQLHQLNFSFSRTFIDAGFDAVAFGTRSEFMEAVAFTRQGRQRHEVQVVVDYGGTWIPVGNVDQFDDPVKLLAAPDRARAFSEWFRAREGVGRVLTIYVRDGANTNSAMVPIVERVLREAKVDLAKARISSNSDAQACVKFGDSDVVYAITSDGIDDGQDQAHARESAPREHELELLLNR